jgi:hypothetical protein
MTDSTRELLERAKKLTTRERAELARELLHTLDEGSEDPATVDSAWRTEIEQRAREALDPKTPAEDWATVRERHVKRLENS